MSTGVEFEEDSFSQSSSPTQSYKTPSSQYQNFQSGYSSGEEKGMSGWLIKHGIAKTPKASQFILISVIIINFIIVFVTIKYFL